jgi:hemolysin III
MHWLDFREPASSWTHLFWLLLAVPATFVLFRLSRGDALKRTGVLVFGLGLIFCSAGSFLFHSVPARLARPFNTLDHIGIYLLIAGTVTPIALVVLRGGWRVGLLGGIWAMALSGVVLRLTTPLPIRVMTVFYLVMGWVGGLVYFELQKRLSHRAVSPVWIGGVFYSVGAVCNGLQWPVIVPGVFGPHDVFHLFVIAGSACHYYFMVTVILPYREAPAAAEVRPASQALPALRQTGEAAVPAG